VTRPRPTSSSARVAHKALLAPTPRTLCTTIISHRRFGDKCGKELSRTCG
jgi:hypothetical protein